MSMSTEQLVDGGGLLERRLGHHFGALVAHEQHERVERLLDVLQAPLRARQRHLQPAASAAVRVRLPPHADAHLARAAAVAQRACAPAPHTYEYETSTNRVRTEYSFCRCTCTTASYTRTPNSTDYGLRPSGTQPGVLVSFVTL